MQAKLEAMHSAALRNAETDRFDLRVIARIESDGDQHGRHGHSESRSYPPSQHVSS